MERRIFGPEHDMFRDSARRFFQKEVEPHRDRWYETGQIDRDIYRKGGEQGLLLMQVAEEYGGAGVRDFRYEQILLEENLRYGDSGLYFTLHSRLVAPYIEGLGTEEQKRRFLPGCASGATILGIAMTEPGAGSDLAGMKTRAEDQGDHFLLNGAKTYISNGINGDLFVVAARTGPGRQLGLFLVERGMPGFARGRNLKKMGLNSQDTAELFFENVRVPKANVLGDPARGFYYLMEYLVEERLISAAQYVAASQVAFDLTLDYIRERRIFGQAVADFQVNRFKMADMRTQIDIAQVFVDHCVMEFNAGRLGAADIARAKLFCSELEGRVTDECVQLHGGAGYMDEYRISRMYRDARVSRIYAGSSEVMREIVARSIGLDPRKPAPRD
ncbi:MAG: acyl-CoA dehydrogenase family protein [Gammaproteobacteria bacterium]|jgi:acyl-CoA dehydrogenase|nr:acyl-CoA dehydrogenase family protein [Gammaproteobacteria bacterium]